MKLETKRLILREWKNKNRKDLIKGINNINVSRWLLVVPYPYKKKDADDYINKQIKRKTTKNREDYSFAIELKSEKKVIGGVGIHKINKFSGKSDIGYWLSENYWRKGYGSEALDALLKFVFNKLRLRRVEAGIFKGNPSSGKLLEKFGAKLEGVHRKSHRCKADGRIIDECYYGLLKEEWRKLI